MAGRIERFKRIARYYRQRKDVEAGRLHEIQAQRNAKQSNLELSVESKELFIQKSAGLLSGRIHSNNISNIAGGLSYLNMEIARRRTELDRALEMESKQRKRVVQADIERKAWEKLVERKRKEAASAASARDSKLMDDIALSARTRLSRTGLI